MSLNCAYCGKKLEYASSKFCDRQCYIKWKQEKAMQTRKSKELETYLKNCKKSNDLTDKEWEECKKFFDFKCAYCGKETDKLEQEHFIPQNIGGLLTKNNIIPSCKGCNCSKNNDNVLKWYKSQSFFSKERLLKILVYLGYL
jgi:endogenous inhibitor of DNA gyrase (YacG/DUF329 family)